MKKIKLLIVEDDLYTRTAVSRVLNMHFPEVEIVDEVGRVDDALLSIQTHIPDLLLLDINLPDGTSFDILRQTTNKHKVVFMSAYEEYALEALLFSAVDFVRKPFDVNELISVIDKAIHQLKDDNYLLCLNALINNIDSEKSQVVLQGPEATKVCHVNDIYWAQAVIGGANFHFKDNSYFFANKPLRRYESMLTRKQFLRCHPHYLINLRKVIHVDFEVNHIRMKNDAMIQFEKRRYPTIINRLGELDSPFSLCKTTLD